MRIKWILIPAVLAAALFWGALESGGAESKLEQKASVSGSAALYEETPPLESFARQAADRLAEEHGWSDWREARLHKYTLGPGTSSWLFLLESNHQEVGYLVITSSPEGELQITEYGYGPSPLFSLNTLRDSFARHELIDPSIAGAGPELALERIYIHPFYAVWKVTDAYASSYYIDAKSGELLPHEQLWQGEDGLVILPPAHVPKQLPAEHTRIPDGKLLSAGSFDIFDPYADLHWIFGEALPIQSLEQLRHVLEQHRQVTFVGQAAAGTITLPLAVTGWAAWSGGTEYVKLEQEGERYIPLEMALRSGSFYARPS